MRRAIGYILALSMLCSVMLSGCGENRTDRNKVTETGTPQSTAAPQSSATPTLLPESMMPDVEDGVVKDDDGVISDTDTGKTAPDDTIAAGENSMDGNSGNSVGTGAVTAPSVP